MVEIFNLIEFFGVAALFGWFSFARLNEEEIEKFKPAKRKKIARANLHAVTNYFLLSFLFYSIAGITDYLYHHTSNPYAEIITKDLFFRATLECFVIGTIILVAPFAIVRNIGKFGPDIGSLRLPPFNTTIAFVLVSALSSIITLSFPTQGTAKDLVLLFAAFPFIGLYVALRYWWSEKKSKVNIYRSAIEVGVLLLSPLWLVITVAALVLLHWI